MIKLCHFLQLLRKGSADFGFGPKEKKKSPPKNRSKNLFLLIWLPFKESEQSHCMEENRNRWKNTFRNHLSSFQRVPICPQFFYLVITNREQNRKSKPKSPHKAEFEKCHQMSQSFSSNRNQICYCECFPIHVTQAAVLEISVIFNFFMATDFHSTFPFFCQGIFQ